MKLEQAISRLPLSLIAAVVVKSDWLTSEEKEADLSNLNQIAPSPSIAF